MKLGLEGMYLPIITPFADGHVDYASYVNLLTHYLGTGISGVVPLGTTGESPTVQDNEYERILATTVETVDGRLPVFVGAGGNDTARVLKKIKIVERYSPAGILSVCPYYNRPGQEGMYAHFKCLSEATDMAIIIYNIPYRTGVNMSNETLLRLAQLPNIVAVKDSCADVQQSMALLEQKPDDFSVLTGDDVMLMSNLAHGGQGGIMAASHLRTEAFVQVCRLMRANDYQGALDEWWQLAPFIPLLFQEPNPAPLKYCLYQLGLLASPETRLPLIPISKALQKRLAALVG